MTRKTITKVPGVSSTKRLRSSQAAANHYSEDVQVWLRPMPVEELIELVNQLPREVITAMMLRDDKQWSAKLPGYGCIVENPFARKTEERMAEMQRIAEQLPEHRLWRGKEKLPINWASYDYAREYYLFLLAARELLQNVERTEPEGRITYFFGGFLKSETFYDLGTDGTILRGRIFLDPCLDGEDGTRIRVCPACDLIFKAKRKNAKFCSDPCGNRTRVRNHRLRLKEATAQTENGCRSRGQSALAAAD